MALLLAVLVLGCGGRSSPLEDAGGEAFPDADADIGPDDAGPADASPDASADGDADEPDGEGGDSCGQTTWLRVFEGEERDAPSEPTEAVVVAANGDILAAGTANGRAWVARFSPTGAVLWQRWLGIGEPIGRGAARAVVESSDGQVLVAAHFRDTTAGEDVLGLALLDRDGVLLSSEELMRGVDSGSPAAIVVADDDRVLVATQMATGDGVLVVFEPEEYWVRHVTFDAAILASAEALVPSGDNTVWLVGSGQDVRADPVLLRISSGGGILSAQRVQAANPHWVVAGAPFTSGGAVLVGGTSTGDNSADVLVYAVDREGAPLWSTLVGQRGEGSPSDPCWGSCHHEDAFDITRTLDDEFVIVGTERSSLSASELGHLGWIVWLNGSGDERRQVRVGAPGSRTDVRAIAATDAGIAIGGGLGYGTYGIDLFVASLGETGHVLGECAAIGSIDLPDVAADLPTMTSLEVDPMVEEVEARPLEMRDDLQPFRTLCMCPE